MWVVVDSEWVVLFPCFAWVSRGWGDGGVVAIPCRVPCPGSLGGTCTVLVSVMVTIILPCINSSGLDSFFVVQRVIGGSEEHFLL